MILVLVASGAEFGGEAGCATAEGVRVLPGACGPLGFPLHTCQCVLLFWESGRRVVWKDRQIHE